MDKNKLAEEYVKEKNYQFVSDSICLEAFLAGFDAAESIANAKIQELENRLVERIEIKASASERIYDELEKKYFESLNKITELEQQLAERDAEIARLNQCQKDAFNVIKSRNDEVAALEQQLKKADEVMRSMHIDTMAWNIKTADKEVLSGWHESNNEAIEKYLKSRGE